MFSTNTYKKRQQQLLQQFDSGLLLFLGNEYVGKNYAANTYNFRQDSSFLYYFGWNQAGLVGLIDAEEGKSYLFGDDLTMDDIVWTGNQPSIADLGARIGVDKTASLKELDALLEKAVRRDIAIHYLPPYRLRNTQKLSQWLNLPMDIVKEQASIALVKAVVAQRSIKSAEEVEEMERAVTVSRIIHHRMMKHARPGILEAELASIAQGIAMAGEGDLAYPPIVTVNGQTLHNHHHHNLLQSGQLVLGDFGGESTMHYAGDVTRTFPVDKAFSSTQRSIYQIVLDAQ
ncbi:MAG: aminopeptidase P N-terminal domain-containing protein, partial [Bacteroidota bacterium]